MNISEQISNYINSLAAPKNSELAQLHERMFHLLPNCRLWFLDGKDENGKIVSNPNIGYGQQRLKYANGKSKDFYQIGLSANSTGLSLYIMGLGDKNYLLETYGETIGKAKVTGYCIKFKSLKDINLATLDAAIIDGVGQTT